MPTLISSFLFKYVFTCFPFKVSMFSLTFLFLAYGFLQLVEAFQSTLEEVVEADLLLVRLDSKYSWSLVTYRNEVCGKILALM